MNRRLSIRFLLGLILLEGRQVSCQTERDASTKLPSQSVPSVISSCKPDSKECKDEIEAHERQEESVILSEQVGVEIVLQKLKREANNSSVPDAVNYYKGVVTFGKKTKFRKTFTQLKWKAFLWRFDLRGFAAMCFLDPEHFDGLNYELKLSGEEMLLGRRCWVYRVTSKEHSKGWHFEGTIWVLPDDLTIIRFKGAFHPMRKVLWVFLVEDNWFSFDSWRKEILPGKWVPDFTCTGVDVAESDFTKPAFQGRITFVNGGEDKPSAASENACELEGSQFPMCTMQPGPNSGSTRQ
jgi:hypothetical protein